MKKSLITFLTLFLVLMGTSLALTSCDAVGIGGDSNGGGGSEIGNLSGTTWIYYNGENLLSFAGSSFTVSLTEQYGSLVFARGTYAVSGKTLTCTVTWVNMEFDAYLVAEPFEADIGDETVFTIIDGNSMIDFLNDIWTRVK